MTKKSVEEPDWDAIRKLTPEQRKTNFLRHRAQSLTARVEVGFLGNLGPVGGDCMLTQLLWTARRLRLPELGHQAFVTGCYCGFQYTFALKRPSTTPI
jgi:hypothetical protein